MLVDKGNHKHFMAKEIHEQPEVVGHTLAHYIDMVHEQVKLPGDLPFDWKKLKRLSISACGTAFYAGLVAKYWFERFAKLPVEIDIASEFRYREAPLEEGDLMIVISQSGETADTLATLALRQGAQAARARGGQRADLDHRPRKRRGDADAGRAGDRRRLDQGLHLPARGARLPRHRRRLRPRRIVPGGRAEARARADRGAAPDGAGAQDRAEDREPRPRARQGARRALSRPRHQLPDRARGRAQAQGNLLHPRRGLCRRRAQARADRADRRGHAGDRHRAARPRVREDRVQHAGGGGARRPHRAGDRRQGRGGGDRGSRAHSWCCRTWRRR